ncbi:C2H2-type zinc finger transcription factor [Gigaspora margarita]|uniref:C2H2-type zinc finger transcription factor n=1 Tax=Gigaspora margarita TaxID=4874 RepID=A0A8H4A4Z4_GIGMA|nr:C2H2-type zinc finger transcription factor [Gigaspora margarita]
MIVLQPSHNDIHTRGLDLASSSIGNFSAIPPQHIPSSMYQTAPQYQQQSFVYPNIAYTSSHHSRSPSTSSLSRHSPADTSFAIDTTNYLYQSSVNTTNAMANPSDVQKASPIQQNHSSPTMMPSGSASSVTLSPDNTSNILPPLSEVFPTSSAHPAQQNSSSASPIQSQVVPQAQSQQTNANMPMTSAATHSGFYQTIPQYSDVNAAAAASFAAQQVTDTVTFSAAPLMSQSQQPQIASNIPVADPRTLPRIGANASEMQALSTGNRNNASMLAINTNGLTVGATDTSPMSAGSSTGSPIVPGVPSSLGYHHSAANAAHHQALLNSHFMAAAQSMNNGSLIAPTTQRSPNNHRRNIRSDDGSDAISQANNGERPQKVYSFVALPGINTKKRPRRRYDEIERHYACNYSGCTKSYGTLNHLNAHVQMQKHGPKRHPSEFKELRKQWRRQKREEEERKAAEAANSTNAKNVMGLNINSLSSI